MKKTILTSIIALAALVSMPVAAQTNNDSKGTAKTEQKACQAKKKGECPAKMKRTNPFEGITLTETQKEALKALTPQRAPKGERPDSAARAQRKARGERPDSLTQRPNPRQKRADYVKNVKSILTPDQYVIFLENIVVKGAELPVDRHGMHHASHKNKGQKDVKKGGVKGKEMRKDKNKK